MTHDEALQHLAKLFNDADPDRQLATLHSEVQTMFVDTLLDLAAARHEIEQLKAQRDATRQYLGVALSPTETPEGDDSPEAILRSEVQRIVRDIGLDRKIQCIKELRGSAVAAQAWEDLGNGKNPMAGSPSLGLKESKDIIDSAASGRLYLGPGRVAVPL